MVAVFQAFVCQRLWLGGGVRNDTQRLGWTRIPGGDALGGFRSFGGILRVSGRGSSRVRWCVSQGEECLQGLVDGFAGCFGCPQGRGQLYRESRLAVEQCAFGWDAGGDPVFECGVERDVEVGAGGDAFGALQYQERAVLASGPAVLRG